MPDWEHNYIFWGEKTLKIVECDGNLFNLYFLLSVHGNLTAKAIFTRTTSSRTAFNLQHLWWKNAHFNFHAIFFSNIHMEICHH